jgi:hypothetical protein
MIMDGTLLFSTAQAITATAASTNIIDLTNARDLGIGNDYPTVKVEMQIGTALTTTNSGTLTVQFQGSTDASSWTTYAESQAYAAAALTANTNHGFPISLPARSLGASLPQYYRLNYVVGTGVFSTGTVTAFLVLDRQWNHSYPAGLTVAN